MGLAKSVEPVSAFKAHSARIIRRAQETGQPIVITRNGKAAAVLQDVTSYERERKTLLLLKFIAQGERSLKRHGAIPHAEVVRYFDKKFKAR